MVLCCLVLGYGSNPSSPSCLPILSEVCSFSGLCARLTLFPFAQFSSVAQLCLTLCDPMDCSTPGFPVHHQFLELAQTHVHRVNDAIQSSHPLSYPSPLPSVFLSIRVFSNESALRMKWPKYWSFSFNINQSCFD